MMADKNPLFSPGWRQAARLKPRLRSHAEIHRHVFRDRVWYVLQDHVSGRFQRFSPAAYAMIGRMNGRLTLEEIWSRVQREFPDEAPSQEEAIDILAKLHAADAIITDAPADIGELSERGRQFRNRQFMARIKSPLAIRFPLIDPEQFLTATLPLVRPLLGWPGRILWIAIVLTGAMLAVTHSDTLLHNVSDRVLSSDNLILLAAAYVIMKLFHELGHAYTVKHRGGEVHEIGIMLLV
ncbi:MAG: PqqD family protein, partial [bacterium]